MALRKVDPTLASDERESLIVAPPAAALAPAGPKRSAKISTVSHTLEEAIAERLRYFAFRERISESAVIEFALRVFFEGNDDAALGEKLRAAGAALRRKA